jgi:Uma2 family endonuclease
MMAEAEYLEYDRTHDGKHEYVNGEVVAMSGVSDAHDRIHVNATVALTIVCGEPAFAATTPVNDGVALAAGRA